MIDKKFVAIVMCWLEGLTQNDWRKWNRDRDVQETAKAALAILKEYEAIPPHYTRLEYIDSGKVVEIHHTECPRCFKSGLSLWDAEIERGQAFCKRCGQAVKWE